MKKTIVIGAVLLSLPFTTFAQTDATVNTEPVLPGVAAVPGFVPGDFFYFLDRWSEALNMAFTFDKTQKARKHLEFAKERVSEIDEIINISDLRIEDAASARTDFDRRVTVATDILREEKAKGSDVANLAREIDDELDDSVANLKDILGSRESNASRAEEEIRTKLATLSLEDPQFKGLTQALESITKEKGNVTREKDSLDVDHNDEQALLEELMGEELSAQKHLEQTMRRQVLLERVTGQVPTPASEQLMQQAGAAIQRGDFDTAKRISNEMEKGFDATREALKGSAVASEEVQDIEIGAQEMDDLERRIMESENILNNLSR